MDGDTTKAFERIHDKLDSLHTTNLSHHQELSVGLARVETRLDDHVATVTDAAKKVALNREEIIKLKDAESRRQGRQKLAWAAIISLAIATAWSKVRALLGV